MRALVTGIAIAATLASGAAAQHNHHGQHQVHRPAAPLPGEAARAFTEANARMHRDMMIVFSGNPDVDFARGMIPHHQGAIDMATIVLRFGKDASVRKLADEIIGAQRKEIAQMQAWLARNGTLPPSGDAAAATKAFEDINAKMHKDMTVTFSGDADVDFIQGMVPHHAGAVDMAKVLLRFGTDPDMRKLAEDVIRTQNAEVNLMTEWLGKRGLGGHRH
jgi:uncharacterized protein (DUF305 family)